MYRGHLLAYHSYEGTNHMQRRIGSMVIVLVLGSVLLSSCGGAQAATSILPSPTAPAQKVATFGATSIALPLSTATNALPATTAPAEPPTDTAAVQAPPTPAATPEQAVAPEQNPAGDIPDTQAFVPYTSEPGGYTLEIPEGWARSADAKNVRFESKLDGLSVTISAAWRSFSIR